MFSLSPVVLGITLFLLGLSAILLTLLFVRLIPRRQPASQSPPPPPISSKIQIHNEAVLLVQSGGRVAYLNQQAREMFNVWEEEPNLESLARRTRPSEAFLTLCAVEGQARFSLNGRFVEGTSYYAAGGFGSTTGSGKFSTPQSILVSLRRPQLVIESDSHLATASRQVVDGVNVEPQAVAERSMDLSAQALNIFTELSQTMAASLDLETTLRMILESVERLLPSDFLEINVWNAEEQHLIPYRLVGIPGVDRHLEKAAERYSADQGYSGYLLTNQSSLLVKDILTFRQARPALDRQRYPFQSYVGVPLLIAGDLVGTLELSSLSKDNYSESDLEVLRLLAGQAAVALKNALLYQQEIERSTELAGLANLTQTVSAIRDPQDLYGRLIESIAPLLQVEILGFLVYEETRRVLAGQAPFMGLLPSMIEWCQATIQPDSPAEAILRSAETIITTNAPEDDHIQTLDLHHLAQAAGMRHAALAPLTSGGRILGYLMVANKRDGSPFDQHDVRYLSIIAGQAAPIIENATLVQQSHYRAQRAETLRRITSLTNSVATLDEILKFSLLDLARLLQADIALIWLLDENRGELRVHKGSLFGISPEVGSRLSPTATDDPLFTRMITSSKRQFLSSDLTEVTDLAPIYQRIVDELKIRSAIDVPLVVRERGIGELMMGSLRTNFFAPGDIQTVASSAGQLAAAIERSTLYSQTDQSLRQRVDQLTALTRVSRELNTTLRLEDLLQRVYDEALRTTQAACGTILLFDLDKTDFELLSHPDKLSEDYQPTILLHFGDKRGTEPGNVVLHPLERKVLLEGESVIIGDFSAEEASNQAGGEMEGGERVKWQATHAGIRSALIVPIAYQGVVAGLIHLHSKHADGFGVAEREITEALAIQAAIALGNAQRYEEQKHRSEELNRRVETLSKLFEVSQVLQTEHPLEQSLEAIAYAIQAATPFDTVLISVYNSENDYLVRTVGAGLPLPVLADLRAHPAPWSSIQSALQPQFCLGRSYFIPAEHYDAFPSDVLTYTAPAKEYTLSKLAGQEENRWQPEDMLIIPLYSMSGEPVGMISVDAPRDGKRPDHTTIEALEIFSGQAALIIESQIKVRELKEHLAKIEDDLELARESVTKAQQHLPVLLHKDLEQTLAMRDLGQRARRIQAGLDIAEIVSKQRSRADVLISLSQQTLARMDFDLVMVAEPTVGGLSLAHTFGNLPADVNPKALLGQRNPLRQCLQTGEIMLVSDLGDNPDWQNTPLLRSLDAKSFMCLPVVDLSNQSNGHEGSQGSPEAKVGEQSSPVAAILAINRNPAAPFTSDDEQLFDLLTRQVAIALQNLSLLDDTSRRLQEVNLLLDFSRQLGSLNPTDILQRLVESALSAVPSAQAGMVALWDARQGGLVPQVSRGYIGPEDLEQVLYQPGEGLPGQVLQQKRPVALEEVDFARHYNLSPENLLHYRNATGGRLPVSSMAVPIMAGSFAERDDTHSVGKADISTGKNDVEHVEEERGGLLGVLVLDNAQTTAAFSEGDLAVVTSLAQQTALTLENARLYQASRQHSNQLQALTGVATSLSTSLEPEALVASMLDQLSSILSYDTGTLWLRQGEAIGPTHRMTDRMVIRSARGFSDTDQRLGLVVDVRDSVLLNDMIQTGHPIWVADVRKDPRFQVLALSDLFAEADVGLNQSMLGYENLSWLGVPLILSGQVIGVIALEKAEANFYTPDDIQLVATFAGQAAVGLQNAELYQDSVQRARELDRRSQTLSTLNRLSYELSGSLDAGRILDITVQEFVQIMPCTSASALLIDEFRSDQVTLQAEYPFFEDDTPFYPGSILPGNTLFSRLQETGGIFNTEDVDQETELAPLADFLRHHRTRSLLIVPIISRGDPGEDVVAEQRLHGMLLAHNSQPHRFNSEEVELARTVSNQVATALQNARLLEETLSLTEDLEIRVQQRTAELARERQRAETLLGIITELSASLDLEQVLHRTLVVLSEYVDAAQITILIARPGERKLHRLASVGYTAQPPAEGSPTPFALDEGLAGWIITQRQSVLVDDVLADERWIKVPYGDGRGEDEPQHRSSMGVPLMSGAEALGCLLLFHPEVGHFSVDQLDLVQAAANQVAIAVNNAELYRLIRDQAEDLGTMLRSQQIETSRSKAILEAVADGVLVTDANRQITLFNESAEKILGLERSNVLGKSMEQFSGIFGRATRRWMEIVNAWSEDAAVYQPGDTYAEQFTLEDGRVISVHLAPVSLRSDFLGTVSIFQDITHQVEVDRLKSEFVATVSHELRTPMTSIKGYVEILLMGAAGQLTDQQAHFLQVVKSNTERLAILVNDLLDISQIEAGRVKLSMQPLNMDEVVDHAIEELKRHTEGDPKSIEISKETQPNLPRVLADPDLIRRVMDILLDNAFQYNLPDGQIMVRLYQVGEEVQVDTKDSGVGIHPDDKKRVFERFFRGENTLTLGVAGTGLGLSIVQNIIEKHGGRIWVESTGIPGSGSTFSFTLPLYRPETE